MTRPPEMTRKAFNAALKRNGFRNAFGGMWFEDTTDVSDGTSYGAIFNPKTMKIMRRATLAKLLRDRAANEAKALQTREEILAEAAA